MLAVVYSVPSSFSPIIATPAARSHDRDVHEDARTTRGKLPRIGPSLGGHVRHPSERSDEQRGDHEFHGAGAATLPNPGQPLVPESLQAAGKPPAPILDDRDVGRGKRTDDKADVSRPE